jgi:DNA-binding response OmpR family regulator
VHGLSILVVEEEYLIAADIEQTLRAAGAGDVAVFRSLEELTEDIVPHDRFDLAVIEARFGHPDVVAFCRHLQDAGIAVVVTSADRAIQGLFPGSIGLDKPFNTEQLLAACEAARTNASSPADIR